MRTQQENEQYLRNLATTMIHQLHVNARPEICDSPRVARAIYEQFGCKIKVKLLGMTPETRGRIADLGQSVHSVDRLEEIPMFEVYGRQWLHSQSCGRLLVTEIACATVVAKMAEILLRECNSPELMSAEEDLADVHARD